MGQKHNALSVKGLEKTYKGGVHALKGIDLEIKPGQFFGLLGPNGAGKSTLIHTITGLAMPSKGTASVFGFDVIKEYSTARAYVGLSPQDINIDWFLTVEQTLDFHGGYYGMPKKERKERIERISKVNKNTSNEEMDAIFTASVRVKEYEKRVENKLQFLIVSVPNHENWTFISYGYPQIDETEFIIDTFTKIVSTFYFVGYSSTSNDGYLTRIIVNSDKKLDEYRFKSEHKEYEERFEEFISLVEKKYDIPLPSMHEAFHRNMFEFSHHFIV